MDMRAVFVTKLLAKTRGGAYELRRLFKVWLAWITDEFSFVLRAQCCGASDMRCILLAVSQELDRDGSGNIDIAEFLTFLNRWNVQAAMNI